MSSVDTPTDPATLVAALSDPDARFPAYRALVERGRHALEAIRSGLRHGDWQVRKWSAMVLDQVADEESLAALVPLLRDPKADVRLWAVHSLACDHCKADVACPVDVVPHLVERVERDESVRVRRMAVIMLGSEYTDRRALPALMRACGDGDAKLRAHAERALARYRAGGVGNGAPGRVPACTPTNTVETPSTSE